MMRKIKLGRLMIMALVVVMVFAFASTAFATSVWFPGKNVYGGRSQTISTNLWRDEPNSMDMSIDALNMNGQSNFGFRGYFASSTTASTSFRTIRGTGTYRASYTTQEMTYMDTKASIASSNTSDWIWFRGSLIV